LELKNAQKRYNLGDVKLRKYFSSNLMNNNLSLKLLEKYKQLFSLVYRKYKLNVGMSKAYQRLLVEQDEIKKKLNLN